MKHFDAAGIAVYALSYDEADALKDFRDAHGITYTLLSDPDSEVIRSFGILNTLIDPTDHPWYGIPYPGTYVVNPEGADHAQVLRQQPGCARGPEQLLRAAQGQTLLEPGRRRPHRSGPGERCARWRSPRAHGAEGSCRPLRVPAGRHVYAEPAPRGSVAVDVVLDENERLVQRPLIRPTSEPHTLAGTGESFQVHHDVFELRLPLTVNSAARVARGISVSGEIRWQSCDDEVCDIPASQRFELELPVAESPSVALLGKGVELEPNARSHFQRMSERRETT